MSDRIKFGRKKADTSNFSHPSLVSPNTPTLANPTAGFSSPANQTPLPTVTEESTDHQQSQSAEQQLLTPEAIKEKPLGHDISRMSLLRPQAKQTLGEPQEEIKQFPNKNDLIADELTDVVQRQKAPTPTSEEDEKTKTSSGADAANNQHQQAPIAPPSNPQQPAATPVNPNTGVTQDTSVGLPSSAQPASAEPKSPPDSKGVVDVSTKSDSSGNPGVPVTTNAPTVDGGVSPSPSPNTAAPTSSPSSNDGGVGSPEYQQFLTQAQTHRKSLANHAKTKKEAISKGAEQEKQGISKQVEVEATRLNTAYDRVIAQVNMAIANAKSEITSNKEVKIAKVKTTAQTELDRVKKVGEDKQAEVKRVGEQKAQNILAFGESEAKRAEDGSKVRQDKANQLKQNKIAQVQGKTDGAQLAAEIEKEAAKVIANFHKSASEMAEMARSRAQDAAKKFKKEGEEAGLKFVEPTEKARNAVIGARDESIKAIQNAAADSLTELQSDAKTVVKNLQTEQTEKLAQVRANADSIAVGVDSATTDANAKVDEKTTEIDSEVGRFQDKITEVKWAGKQIETASLDLQLAIDQHNAEMETLANNVIGAIGKGIKDAIANLGDVITKQIAEVTKVGTEFDTKATAASNKVVNAMEEQRTEGDEEMKKPGAELDKQLQLAVQRAGEGWDRNLTEARNDISHGVDDGLRKQDDAIAAFDSALSGIASKAGSWLSSAVDAIKNVGSFLAGVVVGAFWHVIDFFVALWDLIKKPLFWIVVVIIAIVLVVVIIYFGWAAVAGVLAAIGKALVVIGIIIGVGLAIYYIYVAITKPDLSPYERGKYVGKAVVEVFLAFLGTGVWARLTGWLARVARIAKVLDMVGDLVKASRLLRRVSDVETVLKLLDKVKDAEKLLELLDKVKDAEEALKLLDKSTDIVSLLKLLELAKNSEKVLQLLEKVNDASKAVQLLEKVKNIDTLLSILGKTTDIENLLKLLEAVKEADKVLLLLEKSTDIQSLLKLVDEIKNVEKLLALLDEIKDAKKLLELFDKVKDADLLLKLAKKVKDTQKLEKLLEQVTDAAQLERLLNAVEDVADLEKLLKEMSAAEIEQFIKDLNDANKFKLLANKYVGKALKHYGANWFKDYQGITLHTQQHATVGHGFSQSGGVSGCHDTGNFITKFINPGTDTKIFIHNQSTSGAYTKFEYSMMKADGSGPKAGKHLKTTRQGLENSWVSIAEDLSKMLDDAINKTTFPINQGGPPGSVIYEGLSWQYYFRNNRIDSIFPTF
jgi:hypothetical protein